MNSFFRSAPVSSSSSSVAEDDRRYNERNRLLARVNIRRLGHPGAEQQGTTQDLSRDGVYFTVRSRQYEVGMRVLVTLPDAKVEWTCEVVRIESLPNGGQGVAVTRV